MSTNSPASTIAPEDAGTPPIHIDKPWGEELILSRTAGEVVKLLRVRPGHRLSLQYHRRKSETLILLSGEAQLTIGGDVRQLVDHPLRVGARRVVAAGVLHRLSAGAVGADILEVASRPPGDAEDIVRLADDYGRAAPTPAAAD